MNFEINYVACSTIFVLMAIIHYFYKRKLPDYVNNVFACMMVVCFLNNSFDIISSIAIDNADILPMWVIMVTDTLFYITQVLFAVSAFLYALAMTGKLRILRITTLIALLMPAIFHLWIVVTNPLSKYLFYFDENGVYSYGPLRIVHYIIPLIYLVLVVVTAIRFRLYIGTMQFLTMLFVPVIIITAVLVQYYNPRVLMVGVAGAAAVLMIYLSLQNPSERIDVLTGHFNSNAFASFCEQQFADRRTFYFLGVRINNLKTFNSILGVENCDRMINRIGDFLYHIPERCIHFRITNSTFGLVTYQEEKSGNIIKLIDERFRQLWKIGEIEVKIDVSISCMEVPRYAASLESILNNLEYCSTKLEKSPEESNFVYVDEAMLRDIDHSIAIERALERAIREKSFEVVYQPIFSVAERKMVSAEALVRLNDSVVGQIPPDVFIPMAEKNGSIIKISNIVFSKVCEFMSKNNLENYDIKQVSFNLSTVECMQESLAAQLGSILDRYGIDHSSVYFEITETAAVNSYARLRDTMNEIIQMGSAFALDDYGTGYSNLDSIIELPFRIIKLDKSLIWSYEENNNSHIILSHIVSMAKDLGMQVLAEGVETDEQKNMVERMGVDYIQGYYFSRPLKPDDFLQYLKKYKKSREVFYVS